MGKFILLSGHDTQRGGKITKLLLSSERSEKHSIFDPTDSRISKAADFCICSAAKPQIFLSTGCLEEASDVDVRPQILEDQLKVRDELFAPVSFARERNLFVNDSFHFNFIRIL